MVSGLVRVRYDVWQGTHQTYFLGTGGIFGLFSALTGDFLLLSPASPSNYPSHHLFTLHCAYTRLKVC